MAFSTSLEPQSPLKATHSHVRTQERKEALQLAKYRSEGKSCLTCKSFKSKPFYISICKIKGNKAVKSYNICHLYEKKEKTNGS